MLIAWGLVCASLVQAQSGGTYDASWYNADAPHLQIAVTADGVYRVEGQALSAALPAGTSLSDITPPETIRLIENGEEIPIQLQGMDDGEFDPDDTITFVGHRNRGDDERWAYDGDASAQSSTYHSLYSDTTYYWMTWGGADGLRYRTESSTGASPTTTALRDTVHAEQDHRYYFGRPSANSNALYTASEGYYWTRFSHNDTSPITFTHTLPVGRRSDTGTEMDLKIRLDAATSSCHRVEVEGELLSGGSPSYESLDTVEWQGFNRQTITVSVSQDRVPGSGLTLRLTSYNDNFSDSSCPDPSSTPNYVLLDWMEAAYTRSLDAQNDRQRFVTPTTSESTFGLNGHSGNTVHVYSPHDARHFAAAITNGTASVTDAPSTAPTPYWAVSDDAFRSPAAVLPDESSNWSASSNSADYLILTTEALRPSAQKLADYRASHDGYEVEVALVENVFDEFDYGRPTPIAIRRFVRASQNWAVPPRFLTIFADAQYPIRDGSVSTLYPEWSVPSFGYAPSDGWFAMQTDGPDDWSEVLAVGRIPVRSVAQGDLFVEKLKTYEAAPLEQWQKRMLLLAGGTNESEQQSLQSYSNRWGEIASDTTASTPGYSGPGYTGMDTLRYYKNVSDALDASFQDSLAVDLERGAGWLNYFGHSAAQTWEIVTDPPSEFDNAGRLPIVISLGCRTGSFAGGRFEEKSAPSLGEQLVVGSVRSDGTPREGTLNGGIAHFGESALGNRLPSARLNDALIQRVFVDTARVLGEAIRSAKAEVAADYGNSSLYVKHLLQYGLLGDPATNVALPDQPDLHVDSDLVSVEPTIPTPSKEMTVSVEVQSRGLIPSDSVTVHLTWERPDGSTARRTRQVERFPLERTLTFSFSPTEQALGTNTFRATVDPNDAYAESNETNNTAEREQIIFSTGVSLISPIPFGTVSSELPTLTFSVYRQTDEPVSVVAQLDSVPDFSSPFLQETRKEIDGVVGTWRPPALNPGTTYYWRARTAEGAEDVWKTSAFTVRPSPPEATWLQKGRLFTANANDRLERSDRAWSFAEFARNVSAMSERGGGSRTDGFVLDGSSDYVYLEYGFGVLVLDGRTGRVRDSESFPTYDLASQYEDESDVGDEQEAIDSLSTFLDDVAREGDYVFVRTRHLARESSATIPSEVKGLFRNLGTTSSPHAPYSQAIDTLSYRDLWLLKARKGHPEATVERVSPPGEGNEIIEDFRISFSRPSGTTVTPRIGPVSNWSTLSWTGTTDEPSDALRLDVLSADSTVLIDDLSSPSGQQSLTAIDPETHPYLRLRATLTDSTTRTAPQLERWSVSYEGVPELVVDPAGLEPLPDTLQQGETRTASLPVVNLGPVASDSVRVDQQVTTGSDATVSLSEDLLRPLPSDARDTSAVRLTTTDLSGQNVFTATATTDGPPERFSSNNAAVRTVVVQADRTPPSVQILNNGRELPSTPSSVNNLQDPNLPFVSTQPSFEIVVEDENPHLPLDDTSHAEVYLKGGLPNRDPSLVSNFRRIPFDGNTLELASADADSSQSLRLHFAPELPSRDSTYTIKVEARDAKGNELEPYQASFRTQTEQVIRDVYPYPNPMSTHTTFAFRVEGGQDEMLHDFALRIYTLSGRLVRELDQTDLEAPLSVGWNTVRWNGRDADGDRVATGVYLYRVRIEGTDQTFRGDVEKVTVIR